MTEESEKRRAEEEEALLPDDIQRDEWALLVEYALTKHPKWMATTINAAQQGMMAAVDRQLDRNADLSLGLWQALSTRPGTKRRDGATIIKAIKSSTLAGSAWAEKAIKKESE